MNKLEEFIAKGAIPTAKGMMIGGPIVGAAISLYYGSVGPLIVFGGFGLAGGYIMKKTEEEYQQRQDSNHQARNS